MRRKKRDYENQIVCSNQNGEAKRERVARMRRARSMPKMDDQEVGKMVTIKMMMVKMMIVKMMIMISKMPIMPSKDDQEVNIIIVELMTAMVIIDLHRHGQWPS